jgi:hypothetical protein
LDGLLENRASKQVQNKFIPKTTLDFPDLAQKATDWLNERADQKSTERAQQKFERAQGVLIEKLKLAIRKRTMVMLQNAIATVSTYQTENEDTALTWLPALEEKRREAVVLMDHLLVFQVEMKQHASALVTALLARELEALSSTIADAQAFEDDEHWNKNPVGDDYLDAKQKAKGLQMSLRGYKEARTKLESAKAARSDKDLRAALDIAKLNKLPKAELTPYKELLKELMAENALLAALRAAIDTKNVKKTQASIGQVKEHGILKDDIRTLDLVEKGREMMHGEYDKRLDVLMKKEDTASLRRRPAIGCLSMALPRALRRSTTASSRHCAKPSRVARPHPWSAHSTRQISLPTPLTARVTQRTNPLTSFSRPRTRRRSCWTICVRSRESSAT